MTGGWVRVRVRVRVWVWVWVTGVWWMVGSAGWWWRWFLMVQPHPLAFAPAPAPLSLSFPPFPPFPARRGVVGSASAAKNPFHYLLREYVAININIYICITNKRKKRRRRRRRRRRKRDQIPGRTGGGGKTASFPPHPKLRSRGYRSCSFVPLIRKIYRILSDLLDLSDSTFEIESVHP